MRLKFVVLHRLTRRELRNMARAYGYRPAVLRRELANFRRRVKNARLCCARSKRLTADLKAVCSGWTTQYKKEDVVRIKNMTNQQYQAARQSLNLGTQTGRFDSTMLNHPNIPQSVQLPPEATTCEHYNVATWPVPGGLGEKIGPYFAKCADCKKAGPERKTESGAYKAFKLGLKK